MPTSARAVRTVLTKICGEFDGSQTGRCGQQPLQDFGEFAAARPSDGARPLLVRPASTQNPLPERLLRQGVLRVCYSISSRLDEAGTSFCFGSVTRRTPSEYAALMPAASMPEISKLLA